MIMQSIEKRIEIFFLQTGDFFSAIENMLEEEDFEDEEIQLVLNQIEDREKTLTTYFDNGVIFPSGRINEKTLKIFVGISKNGILYKEKKINIIVLFLYSDNYFENYIDLLSYFKRFFLQKSINSKILAFENEEFVEEFIIKGLKELED